MARSSLRLKPLGASLPQHFDGGIPVHQFAAFSLGKAFLDVRCHCLAIFEHPVFEVELFADFHFSLRYPAPGRASNDQVSRVTELSA